MTNLIKATKSQKDTMLEMLTETDWDTVESTEPHAKPKFEYSSTVANGELWSSNSIWGE